MANNSELNSYQVSRDTLRILFNQLPWDRTGDYLFQYAQFLNVHRRHPSDSYLFNDVLYKIKSTSEILKPLRTFTTDKEFVKKFIKAEVGDSYNVPTIAVLRSHEDIEAYDFSNSSCFKPTHLSGVVGFSDGGALPDRTAIKKWLNTNHYRLTREANYRDLTPKVIVEPILFNNKSINDYKVFCFNGSARVVQVDIGRRENHTRNFFNTKWEELGVILAHPRFDGSIARPTRLEEMIDVAQKLSTHFGFVRIDFYSEGSQLYVGEITHCHGSACERFGGMDHEVALSEAIFF